ncbi:hypothetical protein ACFVW8_27220 [Streptomyces sp. NPDC058221]|uniref:hypothetical protein n=1 Tax=Streptomyces sp. NPDC058221 TaxID=3346388 RepID=UPI0036E35948
MGRGYLRCVQCCTARPQLVVVDYLWGHVTQQAMPALLTARTDRAKALAWIQIGSMAGPDISLPSYLLRAANLNILGSGQGSVTTAGIVAELPSLAEQIVAGTLAVDPLVMPLSQVEQAWNTPTAPGRLIVLMPRRPDTARRCSPTTPPA